MTNRETHVAETVAWQGNKGARKPDFGGRAPTRVTGHFVQHPGSSTSNDIGAEPLPPDELLPAIVKRLNQAEDVHGAKFTIDRDGRRVRVSGTVPSPRVGEIAMALVRGTPGVTEAVASLDVDGNARYVG